jgi:hypothetical protein
MHLRGIGGGQRGHDGNSTAVETADDVCRQEEPFLRDVYCGDSGRVTTKPSALTGREENASSRRLLRVTRITTIEFLLSISAVVYRIQLCKI